MIVSIRKYERVYIVALHMQTESTIFLIGDILKKQLNNDTKNSNTNFEKFEKNEIFKILCLLFERALTTVPIISTIWLTLKRIS